MVCVLAALLSYLSYAAVCNDRLLGHGSGCVNKVNLL